MFSVVSCPFLSRKNILGLGYSYPRGIWHKLVPAGCRLMSHTALSCTLSVQALNGESLLINTCYPVNSSRARAENIVGEEWVQKIRSPRFDSCLNAAKRFLQLWQCKAARSQSNSLLGWSPAAQTQLMQVYREHTENVSLLTCYFWHFTYNWELQSNGLYFSCILHQLRNEPVPNSCPSFYLHKATIDYLQHKMEELCKKQAILLSHELQPHEASAKPCRESFSWSLPTSHSKPITIFCQFVRGWH